MALLVFLRGINVGGHRRLKTTVLARQLGHLDVVSVGSAGTLVVRAPVTKARLLRHPAAPGEVHFVSVLSGRPRRTPPLPITLPSSGTWMVQILGRSGHLVFGRYRRHMKVIGYLGALDTLFGVPATTRNVRTIETVARLLPPADTGRNRARAAR